jgi:glycosyltransferase 2 family protein
MGSHGVRRHLLLALRIAVPLLALAVLAWRLGPEAFRPALAVLAPLPILAALLLGVVAVAANAARWRVVMHGAGLPISRIEAVAEYYRSAALNSVLPGGVAGDVLRAWRQRTGEPQGWRPGAVSVLAERAAGLCLLLVFAAVVLAFEAPPAYPAVIAVAMAAIAWVVCRPSLRRLHRRDRAAVWGWSALALASLFVLTVVAALAVGVDASSGAVASLGMVVLAGTAVPLNLGGWGPREAAGAVAAVMVGVAPAVGVSFAAGFGLLATVSVLPGFVVLGLGRLGRRVTRGTGEVELDADVVVEEEAPRGHPDGVSQPVTTLEPQAGHAVADQQRSGRHQ